MIDTNPSESEVKQAVSIVAVAVVGKGFQFFKTVTALFDRLGNTPAIEDPYMTKNEVAKLTKYSVRTVEKWMRDGTLPYSKQDGRVIFKRIEVERFARQLE